MGNKFKEKYAGKNKYKIIYNTYTKGFETRKLTLWVVYFLYNK